MLHTTKNIHTQLDIQDLKSTVATMPNFTYIGAARWDRSAPHRIILIPPQKFLMVSTFWWVTALKIGAVTCHEDLLF